MHVPLRPVMRPRLPLDPAGIVTVNQRAAVQVESKAVFARSRAIGGDPPVHIMRQPRPFSLVPVHWKIFSIPQPSFFKVKHPQNSINLRRLRKRNGTPE